MKSIRKETKKTGPMNALSELPEYPTVPLPILLSFCGYVVIWYLQIGVRFPVLGSIRIEFLWALFLVLIIFFYRNVSFPRNPLTPYIFSLFGVMLISIPFSCNVALSWDIFFNRVVKFAFMGLFISCFVKSPKGLRVFLTAFLLACGKMVQEGVHGQLTGTLVWQNQGVMRLHGPTPLYRHPNSFSGMALGTIPFVLYLWRVVSPFVKILLLFLILGATTIVLFTGSRTGYMAFLLLTLVAFVRSRQKIRAVAVIILLVLVTINYIPQQYKGRFMSSFFSYQNKNSSAGKRVQILKDAVAIFIDHPFGVGVGAFPTMRERTFGRIQDTHNLYLEVLTNIGVQGFIIFIFFVTKMLRLLRWLDVDIERQITALSQDEELLSLDLTTHRYDLLLMQSAVKAVFLFIVVRLGLGLFGMDLYEIYWWFASGLTIALWTMNSTAQLKTSWFLVQKKTGTH